MSASARILMTAVVAVIGLPLIIGAAIASDMAFLVVSCLYLLYWIPSAIAIDRAQHNWRSIFILNLFLGWTVIGWVIALVWAFAVPHASRHA